MDPAIDEENREFTRLTRFVPGADSFLFGPKGQDYQEEAMITQGGFYAAAFRMWLEIMQFGTPADVNSP